MGVVSLARILDLKYASLDFLSHKDECYSVCKFEVDSCCFRGLSSLAITLPSAASLFWSCDKYTKQHSCQCVPNTARHGEEQ